MEWGQIAADCGQVSRSKCSPEPTPLPCCLTQHGAAMAIWEDKGQTGAHTTTLQYAALDMSSFLGQKNHIALVSPARRPWSTCYSAWEPICDNVHHCCIPLAAIQKLLSPLFRKGYYIFLQAHFHILPFLFYICIKRLHKLYCIFALVPVPPS